MRSAAHLAALLVVLAACAKGKDTRTTDSASGAVSPAPGTAAAARPASSIRLADLAGTWSVVSTPTEGSNRAPMKMVMRTADTTRWIETLAGHPPVTLQVRAEGDSIVTHADAHESLRRKGVQVTTDAVWRREGDKLVGVTVAHYTGGGADSVLHLRSEATKNP